MEAQRSKAEVLEQLAGINQAILLYEAKSANAVLLARELGASWTEVGDRLGITRSGAWKKYHKLEGGSVSPYLWPLPPEGPTA